MMLTEEFAEHVAAYLHEEFDEAVDVQEFLDLGVNKVKVIFEALAPVRARWH